MPVRTIILGSDGQQVTSFGAGEQYLDNKVKAPTIDKGTVAMGDDGTNLQFIKVDADGHLQADILSGGAVEEQYPDNEAVGALKKGNIVLGTDGANYQTIAVDTEGKVKVVASRFGWTPVYKQANFTLAQTGVVVWTPAAGKSIVLMGVILSTDTAMNMTIKTTADTVTVIPKIYLAINGGANISNGSPLWKGAVDATLSFTSSAAGNHSVFMWGYEE